MPAFVLLPHFLLDPSANLIVLLPWLPPFLSPLPYVDMQRRSGGLRRDEIETLSLFPSLDVLDDEFERDDSPISPQTGLILFPLAGFSDAQYTEKV